MLVIYEQIVSMITPPSQSQNYPILLPCVPLSNPILSTTIILGDLDSVVVYRMRLLVKVRHFCHLC